MSFASPDALVVGAGPNGLAAAITIARAGCSVAVVEAAGAVGGCVRSADLTLPGFVHDICSSVYPLGIASPFFRTIPLASYGAEWVHPPLPLAHPFDDGSAAVLARSPDETAAGLGGDADAYRRVVLSHAAHWEPLLDEVLAPPHVPRHPLLLARFARHGLPSAARLAARHFRDGRTRALFAGLAAHSTLPLEAPLSSAVGVMLALLAHTVGWPFVRGGAQRLSDALAAYLRALGGGVLTDHPVSAIDDVRSTRAMVLDVGPRQLLRLAGTRLPRGYRAALESYRYGPGVFKIDWALARSIPWRAPACGRAGTVHVGGTFEEIAAAERAPWEGTSAARPFVIVTQPSIVDASRAPAGRHAAWGYCHVPHASTADMTKAIEAQIERFAPGFGGAILARHATSPADLERRNPNLVGGSIGGGVIDLRQLAARPTLRRYRTPLPGVFLCSSSTPPGGGVHGMCGYHAARAAMRALDLVTGSARRAVQTASFASSDRT